ncbi:DUF1206 domain-containing protein [Tropicimonas sp. IMCC34011]|uniref:DUF1206 domain-containing protein n=1 Tax=Tropicimonas sp. IMCC34011 TaxID=2248759 RepID=UPI000E28581D|nr:DUF1206 domain-containing protein [Tropicimonas sp. IMCC34011]
MSHSDFSWAIPVMRAGYSGRGLIYTVVGGYSAYAIWRGGNAQGTSEALAQLETTTWGGIVLALIAIGMICYAAWRVVDCIWDLEDYGSDGKGMIARTGMIVTGVIHLAFAFVAISLLFTGGTGGGSGGDSGSGSGSGGGSSIVEWVGKIMEAPAGRWIVGIGGVIVIGAGLYYLVKAWKEKYREHLMANKFTTNYNWLLKAGVAAQGVVVTVIGGLLVNAAISANPSEAGGMEAAFGWLSQQAYGRVLVTALALGLLCFAFFCFVNAAYRIVPKAAGPNITSLARQAELKAKSYT